MAEEQREILEQLRAVKDMTEKQQAMTEQQQHSIDALVHITEEQSAMIDKMWRRIDPILLREARKEELKQQVLIKLFSGGVWATAAGLLLVIWQGIKFYLKGD